VVREVREEVGLDVPLGGVVYHSSQPWPFPASLMLGFHARAGYAPLNVYTRELESARWVSRDALLSLSEDDDLRLPRPDSIARRLIEDWLARDTYQQS
jgi:NAD+ diphosphatase